MVQICASYRCCSGTVIYPPRKFIPMSPAHAYKPYTVSITHAVKTVILPSGERILLDKHAIQEIPQSSCSREYVRLDKHAIQEIPQSSCSREYVRLGKHDI